MSSEKYPTAHLFIPGLFDIQEKNKLLILPSDSISTNFVSKLLSNLSKRFPECVSGLSNNALPHFLDPKFKGHLLSRFKRESLTISQLKRYVLGDESAQDVQHLPSAMTPQE